MCPFDFFTKIAIPLLVPLIVIFTGAVAFRRERTHERLKRAESVFTLAVYSADLYGLFVGHDMRGKPSVPHFVEFQKSFEAMMTTIMSEADIGRRFYDDVRFTGGGKKMFHLLAEARIRVANATPAEAVDVVVGLALYTVVYLYEKDAARRSEIYSSIKQISASKPLLFEHLTIAEHTPCLAA
jgi:hypothetical protein